MSLLHDGQIIRDTYEVERLLGEGAFAEVYRVKHRFLGRQAMKVFKMVGMTIQEIEEMLGEAVLLSRMGHPNIVRVFDANVTASARGPCGFFTLEYVAGGSLDQFWRSYGMQFVPVATSIDIMSQVSRGIAVAHEETPPIIHRDIKPQNILVGYDGAGLRVRVSDFGLAKRVNPLTLLASSRGTRAFKAPEAFVNLHSDSSAGDVWALGSTLYLLLTDRLPYAEAGEMEEFDCRVFERPIIPASRLNIEVDPALDQILLRALALKPQDRHRSAKELLADLVAWKPRSPASTAKSGSSSSAASAKSALGMHSPVDEHGARKMAAEALDLARDVRTIADAADRMEEAFNRWPNLREQFGTRVKLWRRGISM